MQCFGHTFIVSTRTTKRALCTTRASIVILLPLSHNRRLCAEYKIFDNVCSWSSLDAYIDPHPVPFVFVLHHPLAQPASNIKINHQESTSAFEKTQSPAATSTLTFSTTCHPWLSWDAMDAMVTMDAAVPLPPPLLAATERPRLAASTPPPSPSRPAAQSVSKTKSSTTPRAVHPDTRVS